MEFSSDADSFTLDIVGESFGASSTGALLLGYQAFYASLHYLTTTLTNFTHQMVFRICIVLQLSHHAFVPALPGLTLSVFLSLFLPALCCSVTCIWIIGLVMTLFSSCSTLPHLPVLKITGLFMTLISTSLLKT